MLVKKVTASFSKVELLVVFVPSIQLSLNDNGSQPEELIKNRAFSTRRPSSCF